MQLAVSCYQKRFFIETLVSGSNKYNTYTIFDINGPLDVTSLQQALQTLVDTYPIFRLLFSLSQTELYNQVVDWVNGACLYLNIAELGQVEKEQAKIDFINTIIQHQFQVNELPLFKFGLLQLAENAYVLILNFHCLIVDRVAKGLIFNSLAAYYNQLLVGQPLNLSRDHSLQTYLQDEKAHYADVEKLADKHYWLNLLDGTACYIPLSTQAKNLANNIIRMETFELDKTITARLADFSQLYNTTPALVLRALYGVLIARYAQQANIALVYNVDMRPAEYQQLVSSLSNQVVYKIALTPQTRFAEVIITVSEQLLAAKLHQRLPIDELIQGLKEQGQAESERFFNIGATQITFREELLKLTGLEVSSSWLENYPTQLDLNFEYAIAEQITGRLVYNEALFEPWFITQLAQHFSEMLKSVLADPWQLVQTYPLLTETEYQQVIRVWNQTDRPISSARTIQALFEEQVAQHPENIAIDFEGKQLSYLELNDKANQLAHYLQREFGVGEAKPVVIMLRHSLELIISVLAVLKAGGYYIAIDPAYPGERINFILNDCQCQMVITREIYGFVLANTRTYKHFYTDRMEVVLKAESTVNLPATTSSLENPVYAIYTSGSTGLPKGVVVVHKNLINLVCFMRQFFNITAKSRIFAFASPSFDASVWEWFSCLASGATLVLNANQHFLVGENLVAALQVNQITMVTLPPSILEAVAYAELPMLKTLVVAGEKCAKSLAEKWQRGRNFFNAYGPTEITVCATVGKYEDSSLTTVPIGKPIANTQTYVLDKFLQPVPIGVIGELYIGGAGVSSGYLNKPELSQQKFIPNPFIQEKKLKLYKTGDLVRWLPDGNLDYVERADEQVKLRGYRIELGAIEANLKAYPGLEQVAVIVNQAKLNEKYLVAFFSTHNSVIKPTHDDLYLFLKEKLPSYMIPSRFAQLSALPLTVNGKVDKQKLLAMSTAAYLPINFNDTELQNVFEEAIADTFKSLLSLEQVDPERNFFELSAHSLLLVKACRLVSNALDIQLEVVDLFNYPSVRLLANYLINKSTANLDSAKSESAIMSKSQSRIASRKAKLKKWRTT